MARTIYLDNAATTPVAPEVIDEMVGFYTDCFGNPSSPHSLGLAAAEAREGYRKTLAGLLACAAEEVIFTGGGSEADNLAVFGSAARTRKRTLVISAIEHPAISEPARILQERGFRLKIVPSDRYGVVDPEQVSQAVDADTFLVSVMHANNEIGSIQPIKEIARAVKKKYPEILVHTDAVQFFGKKELHLADGLIDMASFAAHKIHGPKGIGALFVKKGTKLAPLVCGGGQEFGLRAGTENLAGIAGFVGAGKLLVENMKQDEDHLRSVLAPIEDSLRDCVHGVRFNGHPERRLHNILSVSVPGIHSQNILHFLEERGILVSAGSACHSGSTRQSKVLEAIGVPAEFATIRISASRYNTVEQGRVAAKEIVSVIHRLRK